MLDVQYGWYFLLFAVLVFIAATGVVLLRGSMRRRRILRDRLRTLAAAHEAARHGIDTERHANYHEAGEAPWPARTILDRVQRERNSWH